MDSWTDQQLKLMKGGGNDQCNQYLQQHGINPRTPIKQKYESPAAQLYKEVLKARVEGRPEPTQLPPAPAPRAAAAAAPAGDAQGMERLAGETDQQYVARQTRLRDEARARMAAKFGNGGMSGSGMQGIGSDPNYNPHAGGYGGGGGGDLLSGIGAGLGAAWGTAANMARSLQDEQTVNQIKSTGASFWGSLSSSVSQVATSITAPDGGQDGLAELQRQVAAQRPTTSKYSGFGSSSTSSMPQPQSFGTATPTSSFGASSTGSAGGIQEAPGLPHEDRNGVERLTGESEQQYVMRQTRLRDEARARMAAKFGGGGGMSSMGSSSSPAPRVAPAPASGNFAAAPRTTPQTRSAPNSGNYTASNSSDFFSSFGT